MTGSPSLEDACSEDIDELMSWFPDEPALNQWAGPQFRFPFTPKTFHEDCRWHDMASYALRDSNKKMFAFGQHYERSGRIHLARIGVHPKHRREGLGRVLLQKLMEESQRESTLPEFSLFVHKNNPAAYELYKGVGFETSEFPKGAPMQDICYYMTRTTF